jgi:hypothetical protein
VCEVRTEGIDMNPVKRLWRWYTDLDDRAYEWTQDNYKIVNVLLMIVFPPYGLFILCLWLGNRDTFEATREQERLRKGMTGGLRDE